MIHTVIVGTYTLTDADWLAGCFLAGLAALLVGFLIVRHS